MTLEFLPYLALAGIFAAVLPLIWLLARENRQLERENTRLTDHSRALQHSLTETQDTLAKTRKNSEFATLASEHAKDGILVQDMSGRILWSNPGFSSIHGRPADEVLGKHPVEFALPPDRRPAQHEIANYAYVPNDSRMKDFEVIENQRANGELFWNQISVSLCRSLDGSDIAVQVCRDVTRQVEQTDELRTLSQKLNYEAKHDELTGASNRTAFRGYFDEIVSDPEQAPVGVLHIDLDDFKNINDTHGHSAGDAVLVHITDVLQSSVRDDDMVSRIGGDEFVVTCPNCPDLNFLQTIANRLVEKLAEPLKWGGSLIPCQASIGAAISGLDPTAEELLARADFALYEAKRSGRNQAGIYDETMQARHEKKILRSNELADALETPAIDCYFQPKMELDTGRIVGVEALARWVHPLDGLISPAEFLPIVKELGLMAELDLKLMSSALQQRKMLEDAGFTDVAVAFNASPELLNHPDFVDRLVWEAESIDVDHTRVIVEVLETTDFGDYKETSSQAATIRRLNEAGYQIHLDDFGIGYAGLSHLATLNVTGVKVDRSLVCDLTKDATSQKIVRKIIELSNDLSLSVIAEGVEDAETAATLQDMGCNIIQGYWLAKPMPSKALQSWLEVRGRQSRRKHA